MANKYIFIEEVTDGGGHTIGFVGKGHVSRDVMERSIAWQVDETAVPPAECSCRHVYLRKVPARHYSDFAFVFHYADGPGRGAFKATEIYVL